MNTKELLIDFLFEKKEISKRALTICERANIISLSDLHSHKLKYGNFLNIRGCGYKGNKELIDTCKRNFDFILEKDQDLIILTEIQFEERVKSLFSKKLGVRSQKALSEYLGDSFELSKIQNRLIFQELNLKMFENIGAKTFSEIVDFKTEVVKLYLITVI